MIALPAFHLLPNERPQRGAVRLTAGILAVLTLTACSITNGPARTALSSFTPYKVEVVQGNFVSKEQLNGLRTGMSHQEVRDILGSSLLSDLFHRNRWDYVFTVQRQGVASQQRRLSLFFNGDALDRIAADEMPTEHDFVVMLDTRKHNGKLPRLEATEKQLRTFNPGRTSTTSANPPMAMTASQLPTHYPPLEPED